MTVQNKKSEAIDIGCYADVRRTLQDLAQICAIHQNSRKPVKMPKILCPVFRLMDIMSWMAESDDHQLLAEFIHDASGSAFEALVTRYVRLVYSTAFRFTGDGHHAEEITQAVFIILAQKAKKLSPRVVLSGWLYQTARLTAANFMKGEIRRRRREQEVYMQSVLNEPTDTLWNSIAPLLDEAMGKLGDTDRNAVVMRFFENKSAAEIGVALRMNEETARRRVNRAVEKLHRFFLRRGISSAASILTGAISSNAVCPAPVNLAKTISAAAAAKGAVASSSILSLAKGALKIMAWTKMKTAIATGLAVVLAAGTATVVVRANVRNSYFLPSYRHFQNLPSGLFMLRRTHFGTPSSGLDYSCETNSPSGEHVTWMMGRNRSFAQLVCRLYNCGAYQVVLPVDAPTERFDYLFTIRDDSALNHFEAAIKKLGYAVHWEERDTQVILLQVKSPNSPGLKLDGLARRQSMRWASPDRLEFRNLALASLVNEIEDVANVPVTDETGLGAPYDYDLNCTENDLVTQNWNSVNEAVGQLGLELVPTNLPVQMLVVENAN